MGWTYFHKPVGVKAVDAIKREFGEEWCKEHVVAASATRDAVFLVVRRHEPDSKVYVPDADGFVSTLAVIAIASRPRDTYNFGYKDMTETMGPIGREAPLSIIAKCSELKPLVGEPEGYDPLKSAVEYRARCARVAAYNKLKRGLKNGARVRLDAPLYFRNGHTHQTFLVEVQGRRRLFRTLDGSLCRIPARYLAGATIVETI